MAVVTEVDKAAAREHWRSAYGHALGREVGWTQFAEKRKFLVEEGDCDCNSCILEALREDDIENRA